MNRYNSTAFSPSDGVVSIHLPPLEKGGRGGFRTGNGAKILPNPPLLKGGLNGYMESRTDE